MNLSEGRHFSTHCFTDYMKGLCHRKLLIFCSQLIGNNEGNLCQAVVAVNVKGLSAYLENLLFFLFSAGVLAVCAAEDPTRETISGIYRPNSVSEMNLCFSLAFKKKDKVISHFQSFPLISSC